MLKYCGKNSSVTNFTKHDAICKKKNQFLIEENNKLKSEQEIYKNLAENNNEKLVKDIESKIFSKDFV